MIPNDDKLLFEESKRPPIEYGPLFLPEGTDLSLHAVESQLGYAKGGVEKAAGVISSKFQGLIRRAKETIRIQVGLDFGTSATKVMYQQLGVAERKVLVVPFDHDIPGYPAFCLPSVASFDTRGNLLLADAAARRLTGASRSSGLTRFKMLLAGQHDPQYLDNAVHQRFQEHVLAATRDPAACTPEALSATYLAFVMRKVRRYLENRYATADLDLSFNTCVPIDQRENTRVFSAFQRVMALAQEIERHAPSTESCRAWLERAVTAWPNVEYREGTPDTRVFVVPEAVAGAAGYLSSLQREQGLHALVDIGAGTTDVSIFVLDLTKRAGARSSWYAARSIPMGAGVIEDLVAQKLRKARVGKHVTNPMVQRALSGDAEFTAECGTLIRNELTRIWHGTNKAWSEAYGHLSVESAWRGPAVRVYLAGGGALIPAARDVFRQSWMNGWGPYPCRVLPRPDSFEGPKGAAPFARLCVAFGLATPIPEMGDYVLPSGCPDDTPPPPPRRDYSQDGDQLLPRYGWT